MQNQIYLNHYFNNYIKEFSPEFRKLNKTFLHFLKEKKVYYGDKVIPNFICPLIITKQSGNIIKETTEKLQKIIIKLFDALLTDTNFARHLFLSTSERNLINIAPVYKTNLISCRHDFILNNKQLTFIEFNTDGPGAMGYHTALTSLYNNLDIFNKMTHDFKIGYDLCMDHFKESILEAYYEWGGRNNPTLAIIDWKDIKSHGDFDLIANYLNLENIKTIKCDPNELSIYKDKLVYKDQVIDIVLRRVTSFEFIEREKELSILLTAYQRKLIFMINPLSSKLVGYKAAMEILTNKKLNYFLTAEEINFCETHIAWTRTLKDCKTDFKGEKIDLLSFVLKNKNQFIIKPSDGFGGINVCIGSDTNQIIWEELINKNYKIGKYVVQEFINSPYVKMPHLSKNWEFPEYKVVLGAYLFKKKYSGILARFSDSNITNINSGGGVAPCYYLEKKGNKNEL